MIGEVIWHSLKRDGAITQYDIRFGRKVLRGIPAGLVEAKQVQEHTHENRKIKKRLREIMEFSHTDATQYLHTQAKEYHKDKLLNPEMIKELLQDDFLDNIGHQLSIHDYSELIDKLSYSALN
tara:strand:+ start:155 stop:523 length:369 start_codon:yes stop_codon:yes gene_type:complete